MSDYTFDPLRAPAASPGQWLASFALANAMLAGLVLLMGPLVHFSTDTQTALARDWDVELSPDSVDTATASVPEQPEAIPPEPQAAAPIPATPPAEAPAPAPTAAIPPPPAVPPAVEKVEKPVAPEPDLAPPVDGGVPLAYNNLPPTDQARPPKARIAGEANQPAQSMHPTPGMQDPVPLQPDGVSGQVLALGTAGSPGTTQPGTTVPQAPKVTPLPAETPTPDPRTNSDKPVGTASATAPLPSPAVAPEKPATPGTAATSVAPGGHEPAAALPADLPPPAPAAPAVVDEPLDPLGEGFTAPSATGSPIQTPATTPDQPVRQDPSTSAVPSTGNGTGAGTGSGIGSGPEGAGESKTPAADSAAAALAAERAALAALKAADQAKSNTAVVPAPVTTALTPTMGDASAVSKTPFWNVRLNTSQAGPDAIETYKEPVAKYLKEFRTLLEQNFFREVSPPRAYRFREGEFADIEMTFHADGSIDGVRLVPESGSKYFTPEMETICKAAVTRSAPYKSFTEELLKERREFKLVVRFHF